MLTIAAAITSIAIHANSIAATSPTAMATRVPGFPRARCTATLQTAARLLLPAASVPKPRTELRRPPETYANPGFAYGQRNGYTNRPANSYGGQSYASRPDYAYTQPAQSYRAPRSYSQPYSSRGFGSRSTRAMATRLAADSAPEASIFSVTTLEPKGFATGRAPKSSLRRRSCA